MADGPGRAAVTLRTARQRSLTERIELYLAQRLFRLPHAVQRLLCGGGLRVVAGHVLHTEMQLLLLARKLRGAKPLRGQTPESSRRAMHREAVRFSSRSPALAAVYDRTVGTRSGALRARHYVPERGEGAPLLVYFHGGGFVLGDLDTHDEPCRLLCAHAGVHVVSIDYRLAPEHPFPAGLEDALDAFHYARNNAAALGASASRVGVGGDSAGANLSAVVSRLTSRGYEPSPAFQLLIYPVTDSFEHKPSRALFARGLMLEQADIEWFDEAYVGADKALRADPRVSPLREGDLVGVCPALIYTAELDPLRDEGEAYAEALSRAGVPTQQRRFDGMIHAFINVAGVSPAARRALIAIAEDLRTLAHAGPSA